VVFVVFVVFVVLVLFVVFVVFVLFVLLGNAFDFQDRRMKKAPAELNMDPTMPHCKLSPAAMHGTGKLLPYKRYDNIK